MTPVSPEPSSVETTSASNSAGNGHHGVGQAHDHGEDPAAEVGRDQAQRRANGGRRGHRADADQQRNARAKDDPTKLSRPSVSVPIQCGALGSCSTLPRSCAYGSYGAISGARMAMSSSATTVTAAEDDDGPIEEDAREATGTAATADRFHAGKRALARQRLATALAVLDARVEPGVDDVDQRLASTTATATTRITPWTTG